MYFESQLLKIDEYKLVCQKYDWMCEHLKKVISTMITTHKIVFTTGAFPGASARGTLELLFRNFIEHVDAVQVLANRGCSLGMIPSMRTILETYLSIRYILQDNSDNRAIAYQIGHFRNTIKSNKRFVAGTDERSKFVSSLKEDDFWKSAPPLSGEALISANKQIESFNMAMLSPEYAPINAEWNRTVSLKTKNGKNKKYQSVQWFNLFDGPANIRELTKAVVDVSFYEIFYKMMCETTHAADAMKYFGRGVAGETAIRPIRHPDGMQYRIYFVSVLCIYLIRFLLRKFAPDKMVDFMDVYKRDFKPVLNVLGQEELIKAKWCL